MTFRTLLVTVTGALAFGAAAQAENLPLDHPAGEKVRKYLDAVVKHDWKATAAMILPASLERKKNSLVRDVKNSSTMTIEAAKLGALGLKDLSELEKLTPEDAYVVDRTAVHNSMKLSDEAIKKKQETMKLTIIGIASEDEGRIVHVIVRTKQDTIVPSNQGASIGVNIEELLLISLAQDKENKANWLIVPDMQQPITTPLKAAAPAAK